MEGAVVLFQENLVAFHLVGAFPGVFAGETGEGVDGAVGIDNGGGIGRHDAILHHGKFRSTEGQRDGNRFRPGVGHKYLIDTGPYGIGITGPHIAQDTAGQAQNGAREKEKGTFHGGRFLQR